MKTKSVCLYGSASAHIDESYLQLAYDVGALIATQKLTLVFGGGHCSMMGKMADGALAHEGIVYGVATQYLDKFEGGHQGVTRLEVVPDMHIRKRRMFDLSDAFVVLPGGFGTLEEIMEILTWKQIGLHGKPIVFYNFNGFWDPLGAVFEKLIEGGFIAQSDTQLYTFVSHLDEILPAIQIQENRPIQRTNKWFVDKNKPTPLKG